MAQQLLLFLTEQKRVFKNFKHIIYEKNFPSGLYSCNPCFML
jgi:hypothetical protein